MTTEEKQEMEIQAAKNFLCHIGYTEGSYSLRHGNEAESEPDILIERNEQRIGIELTQYGHQEEIKSGEWWGDLKNQLNEQLVQHQNIQIDIAFYNIRNLPDKKQRKKLISEIIEVLKNFNSIYSDAPLNWIPIYPTSRYSLHFPNSDVPIASQFIRAISIKKTCIEETPFPPISSNINIFDGEAETEVLVERIKEKLAKTYRKDGDLWLLIHEDRYKPRTYIPGVDIEALNNCHCLNGKLEKSNFNKIYIHSMDSIVEWDNLKRIWKSFLR